MLHFRLRVKFLILVVGSLVVFLGILSYVIVQRESRLLTQKNIEKQHVLAHAIFEDLKENMKEGRPRGTLNLIKSLQGTYGLVRLEVLRRGGAPVSGAKGARFNIPMLEQVFGAGNEISYQENDALPLHTILSPLKNERECRSCHGKSRNVLGVILISLSMEDTLREIATSTRNLTALLSLLILMTGTVIYVMIRKVIVRPLATLHLGAERIGRGDLSHRISLATRDEMEDLARAFNIMAARLQESYSGLESKIRERTAEVEDKARRLASYGRSLSTVTRLSTVVFNADQPLEELLDRFMRGISRGLGYERAMLCLVDRKKVRLDKKRDAGLGEILRFSGHPLSGSDPLVKLIRAGKAVVFDDIAHHAGAAGLCNLERVTGPLSLAFIPILRHKSRMCWKVRSCVKTDCPAYGKNGVSCWMVENTCCGNALMESYGDKLAYCMTCDLFPVVGVLIVAAEGNTRALRGRNLSVLRILAAEMGAALDNHRLHEDKQRTVRELLELHTVTALALADPSLDRALEAFTDSALKFSGLDACGFWLVSEDGRELVRRAGGCAVPGVEDDFCPERVPANEGLLGEAFLRGNIAVEYNASFKDSTALGRAVAAHGMNSLLAVPLKTESRPIGVFAAHKRSSIPFLETEVAAFMLLANQAAMAINVCTLNEELKNQNIELTRSANLMGGILSSMSSGVALLNMDGAVKLINLPGAQILRIRREDVVGRRLGNALPGLSAFETAAFIKVDSGLYQEIDFTTPDGTMVPIGFSSTYYRGASGAQEGVIVVFRDLTEIKALQAELLDKERFAAMGRVVAGVAHEIRNPLFGISSIGQIFERELANPAHLELVSALLSETRRLNQLVEELLIYGRPMKLVLEPCDLGRLWDEVLEMHAGELEKKRIRVAGDYGVRSPLAWLDPNQIRQVFLNLLRNSMEAASVGGKIGIKLLLEDRFIIFKVSDSGAGIPPENMDKVFDLFFTTKPKGTGLGLAICRKIVQDHGGEIGISSEEGKGTTVTVKLPYRGVGEKQETETGAAYQTPRAG